jgi:hypothetical protein
MAFGSKQRRITDLEAREEVHVAALELKDARIEHLESSNGRQTLLRVHEDRQAAYTRVAELEQQLRDLTGEFVMVTERLTAAEAAVALQAKGDDWKAEVAS